jgi:hypothetical protein
MLARASLQSNWMHPQTACLWSPGSLFDWKRLCFDLSDQTSAKHAVTRPQMMTNFHYDSVCADWLATNLLLASCATASPEFWPEWMGCTLRSCSPQRSKNLVWMGPASTSILMAWSSTSSRNALFAQLSPRGIFWSVVVCSLCSAPALAAPWFRCGNSDH